MVQNVPILVEQPFVSLAQLIRQTLINLVVYEASWKHCSDKGQKGTQGYNYSQCSPMHSHEVPESWKLLGRLGFVEVGIRVLNI